MNTKRRVALFLWLGLAAQSAGAVESSNEADFFLEFPVVLSASRLYQPLADAPNAMTVIDRKMIVASGFRTIPDLFKLVPGMYVSYYKGSQPIVAYHGSPDQYARRMQVMIDGRSVYLPPGGTVTWGDLPLTVDDIERIEVIRGPAAASHGANSTQGVISIITRDAGSMDGKRVSVTRGNKGVNDLSMRFGKSGDSFDYRFTLAYTADNGYDDLSSPPNGISINQPQATSLLHNNYDSNQARLMNFRANYHPDEIDRIDFQFGLNHDVQGVGFIDKNPTPSNPNSTNGNTPHDLIDDSGFLQLGWVRQLDDESELNVLYYHVRQDRREAFPVYLGGAFFPGPVSQSLRVGRDELSLQHTLRTSASNRVVYGTAYRTDKVEGRSDMPPLSLDLSASETMDEWRVFAHDEWNLAAPVLLNTGAMFEHDRMGHENWSPRIAMNYRLFPQHTLRTGVSVAYRTPALAEEKFPAIQPGDLIVPGAAASSPGLQPERIVSREIGYLGVISGCGCSLDLRVYSDLLSDGIYFRGGASKFANGFAAEYRGFEATLKYAFAEGELTANLARASASSNARELGVVSFDPANDDILSASIPRNSASLLYALRLGADVALSAAYYYQSALQPYDRGPIDRQPQQRRVDVRLAQALRDMGGFDGEAALVVQNLFDQQYTEYVANNVFDRRIHATLTMNW